MSFSVIVGLGNPGRQYDATRHNIGFAVVDLLRRLSGLDDASELVFQAGKYVRAASAGDLGHDGWSLRDGLLEAKCSIADWSGYIVKPMTYMNRSGEPLQRFLNYRKIAVSQVIVVHDEIDIPFGSVRVKVDGGEGGHNGLRSISQCCGSRQYARVRVGVGKPPPNSPLTKMDDAIANWVLSSFSTEEQPYVEDQVIKAAKAVYDLATQGS